MRLLKKHYGLFLVFLISLIPLNNLLNPGLPISHDGIDHIYRIANFYKNLEEGVLIPRWAGNLNWGFGHPILMFLYPLPSYFASFFHFLGLSFVDSYKLVLGASYTMSGIFMYLWLKRFLGAYAAIVGATFYLYAPYRFIDLYVRGAIGEHVAFAFIPLVLFALLLLNNLTIKDKLRKYYFGSLFVAISTAGLLLSHNAISLIFIPFILFYVFYLFYEHKSRKNTLLSLFSIGMGFAISFFFWFPAFFEGKYTLRDIVTNQDVLNRFVNIPDLIYEQWSYGGTGEFSVQIGLIQIIIVILSIVLFFKLFKKGDRQKILYLGTLFLLLTSIFLMIEQSRLVWETITTFQKFQFPWRFLTIVVFCISLIGALFVYKIDIKRKGLLVLILVLLAIIPTITYWQAKEYKIFSDNNFESIIESTTDTGESAPIWSVRFMEKVPSAEIEIIDGNAEINKIKRTSTYHEYSINVDEKTRIRENTLYFPGWKVFDNKKEIANVEFQDPKNRGIITFNLDEGEHNIVIKFEETKLRSFANYITYLSIIFIIIIPIALFLLSKSRKFKYKW